MDALASELYYIAVEANLAGRPAVIDSQSVAILMPIRIDGADGPAYVSFQVTHVQTAVEARALLQTEATTTASARPEASSRTSNRRAADRSFFQTNRRRRDFKPVFSPYTEQAGPA